MSLAGFRIQDREVRSGRYGLSPGMVAERQAIKQPTTLRGEKLMVYAASKKRRKHALVLQPPGIGTRGMGIFRLTSALSIDILSIVKVGRE